MNEEGLISPYRTTVKIENTEYKVTIKVGQPSADGNQIPVDIDISDKGKTYKMSGNAISLENEET